MSGTAECGAPDVPALPPALKERSGETAGCLAVSSHIRWALSASRKHASCYSSYFSFSGVPFAFGGLRRVLLRVGALCQGALRCLRNEA